MRQVSFLFALLLCAAAPALAQVTLDLHALDAVPGAKPAPPHKANPPRHVTHPLAAARPSRPPSQQAIATPAPTPTPTTAPAGAGGTTPPSPALPAPPAATLPDAAPATVAIAPVAPPPAAEAPPPPPPPVSETAKSAASATGEGLRVTFGAGESDLSPASAEAIHGLVKSSPPGDATSYNVVAYAAGTPEDPSTARRVSLSRALAVRSALIADGVGSARIYVRALGSAGGGETPDRVEVTVLGANAPTSVPASTRGQAPAAPKNQNQ